MTTRPGTSSDLLTRLFGRASTNEGPERRRARRARMTLRRFCRTVLVYVLSLAVAPAAVQSAVPVVQSPEQLPFLVTPVEAFSQQAPREVSTATSTGWIAPDFARSSGGPSLGVLLAAA